MKLSLRQGGKTKADFYRRVDSWSELLSRQPLCLHKRRRVFKVTLSLADQNKLVRRLHFKKQIVSGMTFIAERNSKSVPGWCYGAIEKTGGQLEGISANDLARSSEQVTGKFSEDREGEE